MEAKETFFMQQLQKGEMLSYQGKNKKKKKIILFILK